MAKNNVPFKRRMSPDAQGYEEMHPTLFNDCSLHDFICSICSVPRTYGNLV